MSSKNSHTRLTALWRAIHNVLTVPYNAWELGIVVFWLLGTYVDLRTLAALSGIAHIPKLVSMAVLGAVWLAVLFIVPIVMRRKLRKGK